MKRTVTATKRRCPPHAPAPLAASARLAFSAAGRAAAGLAVAGLAAWGTVAAAQAAQPAGDGPSCSVRSSAQAPVVVELYTSEGCSSCPPADRWLSSLKGRSDVLALNFHVTYWDRLGWPDRFANDEYTQRQYGWARLHGSRQVYTPQVIVNGDDWRRWPQLPARGGDAEGHAPVQVQLTRRGGQVLAEVSAAAPGTGAPADRSALPANSAYSGYWAVLEDGHATRVRAGENSGETLHHDHVVRLLRPVPAWPAGQGLRSQLAVTPGAPNTPRRVAFVVVDAATQRPVQAVVLGGPGMAGGVDGPGC